MAIVLEKWKSHVPKWFSGGGVSGCLNGVMMSFFIISIYIIASFLLQEVINIGSLFGAIFFRWSWDMEKVFS